MLSSVLLGVALQLAATQPAPDSIVYHAILGRTVVPMSSPIDATIVVDGLLDEAVWQRARRLTGFSLYQPVDQRPAPDSTDVLVWYSPSAIHFGIRAYEPHGAVRATLAERDRVGTDDNVEIHLDTFEERRRAFVFIVNPLGVQADGTKNESGGFIPGSNVMPGQTDLSADFQWQSRGRVTDAGYEVEIRIPFSSLRFPVGGAQRWGLQILRKVQHSGYEETWTPVRRGAASFISQEGWLTGLTDMRHGVDITLNPELTSTIAGTPCCTPGNSDWRYTSRPRLGGNIRAGLGSNIVLVGTVRPDFSQVEADATQVAADPRFALFYAERRPFFVEGSDQFNVPNTLVYTRRIVQPDAALKLNVRQGRTNVALLSALDAPSASTNNRRPLVDILRVTRDFSAQSTAGLVYSERVSKGNANRVLGGDAKFLFGRMYYAQLQFAGSQSRTAGVSQTGALWEAVVDRTGRGYGFHYNLLGIRPEFRADNGFVARTGYVQPNAANRVTFFGKQGALVERYMVFMSASGLWRYRDFFDGKSMLEGKISASNFVTLRRGWSVSLTPTVSTYAFDPAAYSGLATENGTATPDAFVPAPRITTTSGALSVSTPQYRRFAASAGLTSAGDVDFLETTRVRRTAYNASLDLRPDERLRVNATYASNEFVRRTNGQSSFSTRIPRVKIEYQVSRPIFVRLISQYEANRREGLVDYRTGLPLLVRQSDGRYAPSVLRSSNLLRADWLFSYRPRPGTVFFAGYGNSMTEPEALGFDRLRRVSDGFFLKASWLFTPPVARY
ncbi:MAG: DUF5916 domain-containing protein [Gemmatimonas sp.]